MAKPKKRKLRVRQKASVRKKGEGKDSLKQMPTKRVLPDNGATLKVKLRKK
jgi:hypothetical protein